jgi:hypothetical protein
MAIYVFLDGYLNLNSNTLSTSAKKITLNATVVDQKTTAFGATWESRLGGLKDGKLSVTFNQDVSAAALDSIMWPLLGTVFTFEVRATSGARSTSNPGYTGSILLTEWTPIDGSVGDLAEVTVSVPTSGAVLRQTS